MPPRALFAMATAPGLPPGVYNVADDTPLTQLDCYRALAELTGRPLPPFGPVDHGRKRGWTSKRVSNARLRVAGGMEAAFSILHGLGGGGNFSRQPVRLRPFP